MLSSLPVGDGESGSLGFVGVRCVGKILTTANVIPAARPTIAAMYTTSSSRPRIFSNAAVE